MTFMDQIDLWYYKGEFQHIVSAILELPASRRTDKLMDQLAVAYNNLGQYSKAILVLEELRPRIQYTWRWQYRMGYALYYSAFQAEPQKSSLLLGRAREAFSNALTLNPDEPVREDCLEFLEWIRQDRGNLSAPPLRYSIFSSLQG